MSYPGKRITLADVAREAGVSVQTASHVLSGIPNVRLPKATRQRVVEAAQKVGYRPNRLAQAMKSGRLAPFSPERFEFPMTAGFRGLAIVPKVKIPELRSRRFARLYATSYSRPGTG